MAFRQHRHAQTASRGMAARCAPVVNPRQMLGKVIGGMFSFGMAAAFPPICSAATTGPLVHQKTGDWTRRLHAVVPIPGAKDEKKRPAG